MIHSKKCKLCGKEFETNYPSKVYCSYRCRNKATTLRNEVWKKCKVCGVSFLGNKRKSYCSNRCAQIGVQNIYKYSKQLCWTCQRATGYCSWSAFLKPVKGWDAEKVEYGEDDFTYKIKSCPLYLPDEHRVVKD